MQNHRSEIRSACIYRSAWALIIGIVLLSLWASGTRGQAKSLEEMKAAHQVQVLEISVEFQSKQKELNKRYSDAVTKIRDKFQQQGNLDMVLAVNEEIKNVESSGQPGTQDIPGIARYRAIFSSQESAIREEYRQAVKRLEQEFIGELEKQRVFYTKAADLDRALAFHKEIEQIKSSLKLGGPSVGGNATKPADIPEKDLSAYHKKVEFDDRAYYYFFSKTSWKQAKLYCDDLGGHLATISGAQESSVIEDVSCGRPIWLGGTDEGSEGDWRWITGEKFDFKLWQPGEPSNHYNNEHYLITKGERRWNDTKNAGDEVQGYVCEFPNMQLARAFEQKYKERGRSVILRAQGQDIRCFINGKRIQPQWKSFPVSNFSFRIRSTDEVVLHSSGDSNSMMCFFLVDADTRECLSSSDAKVTAASDSAFSMQVGIAQVTLERKKSEESEVGKRFDTNLSDWNRIWHPGQVSTSYFRVYPRN